MSGSSPLQKVLNLRSQGTPNNQIIQILQQDGFASDQIFDAMNQADMQQNIGQGVNEPAIAPPPQMQNPMGMQPPPMPAPAGGQKRELIEETTEAIVSEKWHDVAGKIAKLEQWKADMDHKMQKVESDFTHLSNNFDKLHHALIGKIGEYDQNILNVGTEIKAMEKVFQKILPTFTENVNELSRMTQKMRGNEQVSQPPQGGQQRMMPPRQ